MMQAKTVLDMIESGQIEELKQKLQEEIYLKTSKGKVTDGRQKLSTLKRIGNKEFKKATNREGNGIRSEFGKTYVTNCYVAYVLNEEMPLETKMTEELNESVKRILADAFQSKHEYEYTINKEFLSWFKLNGNKKSLVRFGHQYFDPKYIHDAMKIMGETAVFKQKSEEYRFPPLYVVNDEDNRGIVLPMNIQGIDVAYYEVFSV